MMKPEITKAVSLTRMVLTPSPRARSSSSLIARSWRPNREPQIAQASTAATTAMSSAV